MHNGSLLILIHSIISEFMLIGNARNNIAVSAKFSGDVASPPPEIVGLVEYCRREQLPISIQCSPTSQEARSSFDERRYLDRSGES